MQNDIKSSSKRRNKRQASKILIQIKKIFNEVLREADDMVFQEDIMRLLSSSVANPYISSNFFPEDMAEYDPERRSGRIRLRLLQAENIYRMPAIYKCPVMAGLSFSYTYEQEMQLPVWAMTRNNFEEKNITEDLRSQGVVNLFYEEPCIWDFPVRWLELPSVFISILRIMVIVRFPFRWNICHPGDFSR